MKIGVVSRGDIFPPNHGAAVKLYYTMTSLSEEVNSVFFITDDNDKYYHVQGDDFLEKEYPNFIKKMFDNEEFYRKLVLWLGVPECDWILYRPVVDFNMWLRTLYVTLREKLDVLQSEFPGFSIPSIFAKLFSLVDVATVEHNIEYFRVQETSEDISKRGLRFYKLVEKIMGKLSEWVITVSEDDKDRVKQLGAKNVEIIPHGVDINRFDEGNGDWIRDKYNIDADETVFVFHGVLNYPPNKEAVYTIVDRILPELEEKLDNFKILIIGGYPPDGIEKDNVIVTGFVDELADHLDAADVAIVPLEAGGGTRLKILEYFASKIPVVSTAKGVEGLDVTDGEEVIVCEIDDMVDRILELVNDDSLYNKLQVLGREFVNELDWSSIAKKYKNLYEKG